MTPADRKYWAPQAAAAERNRAQGVQKTIYNDEEMSRRQRLSNIRRARVRAKLMGHLPLPGERVGRRKAR